MESFLSPGASLASLLAATFLAATLIPLSSEAVLFAVTLPETVHLNEIMVRPAQQLQMPGMNLPR